jgi:hypothetical protein
MKLTNDNGVWTAKYRGFSMSHPEWENETDAINDTLTALVGLPVKVSREADGDWRAQVHKLSFTMPYCDLYRVADNVVTLADALHRAADTQHKHSTGGVAAPKRAGMLWATGDMHKSRRRK